MRKHASVLAKIMLQALLMVLVLSGTHAFSGELSLRWNPNLESDIAGYKLHYGTASWDYEFAVDVGNETSYTLSGLQSGMVYYCAASAYDTQGNESDLSEEVVHVVASDEATVYEDAEDGKVDGWYVYDNSPVGMEITNVFDEERQSRVIQLSGSGQTNGASLRNRDFTLWQNAGQFVIQWSMKYAESFTIYIDVETTAGHRYMYYTPVDHDGLGQGEYVHHGLGTNVIDGRWRTFVRELQADLRDAQPGVSIIEVNGFLIRGSGRVDDIKLLDAMPSSTVYEDAEDGTVDGWYVYDNTPKGMEITNVFDEERQSRVIEFSGAGQDNCGSLRNADLSKWRNDHQFVIQWSLSYTEYFTVYLDVETTAGHRYVYYTAHDHDGLGQGEYVHHGLGTNVIDGRWRTFVRDLRADLRDAQPGVSIIEVNGFLIRGSGRVDDIKLLDAMPSSTVYEDAEDGTVDGWYVYDNTPEGMEITNVFDEERQSRVIQLTGAGRSNGGCLRNPNFSVWQNTGQFVIQWSMKYAESFTIYIDVETTAGHRYMYYTPVDSDGLGGGGYVHHGLGSHVTDGQWRTFVRDLEADLADAQPEVTILEVNGFLIRGSGRLDDIMLHDQMPLDGDEDGIDDALETAGYGTDPTLMDTDGDGINDGNELAFWQGVWGTDYDADGVVNLLDGDSDGDGYLDGEEIAAGSDPADPYSVPPGASWTDYRVMFTMGSNDNDAVGLMFRFQDADNYYRFSWDNQRDYRRLVKCENGVFTLLAEDSVGYVTGETYEIEVVAEGTTLEVFVDDELVFSVTDQTFTGGTIGLYSWGNRGSLFDNVLVEDLSTDVVVLWEDFGDGDYSGWSVVDEGTISGPSAWSAESGTLVQSANIYSGPTDRADLSKLGTFVVYDG
ncbi:MAG: fibronectin type III domain-containing protein [Thermodesulfobacteriota bacterium]|nr:fibronectin type III domain-containing protein [Thermodesulfobacteriota bacterium]